MAGGPLGGIILGLTGAVTGAIAGGITANNAAYNEYISNEKNKQAYIEALGESGRATIRNIAINNIDGLAEASAETQSVFQDIFYNMSAKMLDVAKGTFDTEVFEKALDGDKAMKKMLDGLDKAVEDGSLSAYSNWLDTLNDQQKELVVSSNEYLKSINKLKKAGIIGKIEALDLTNDETNTIYSLLSDQAKAYGKDASDVFKEVTDAAEAMAKDGTLSAENMYAAMAQKADE